MIQFAAAALLFTATSAAPSTDETAIAGLVETLLTTLTTKDSETFVSSFTDDAVIRYTLDRPDGTVATGTRTPAEFGATIPTMEGDPVEKAGDYIIKINGPIASVWMPYTFEQNRTFRHCGVNIFTLIKSEGDWRVSDLTYDMSRSRCGDDGFPE